MLAVTNPNSKSSNRRLPGQWTMKSFIQRLTINLMKSLPMMIAGLVQKINGLPNVVDAVGICTIKQTISRKLLLINRKQELRLLHHTAHRNHKRE